MDPAPSIFNDVIGPVMRGPSSSHSAAALRIGRICRNLMHGDPGEVLVKYGSGDALATTHKSQGSDFGMQGGLLGFEADDPRLLEVDKHLINEGIKVEFLVTDTGCDLPNHYLLQLRNKTQQTEVLALSTGGGMIEVIRIDETVLSMHGDCFVTLIFSNDMESLRSGISELAWATTVDLPDPGHSIARINSLQAPDQNWIKSTEAHHAVALVTIIEPVLPILTGEDHNPPFLDYPQMLRFNQQPLLSAWELAVEYESARGNIGKEEVKKRMKGLYEVMRRGITDGLKGTEFNDRLLGPQSKQYKNTMEAGVLAGGETIHNITMYVSALMEVKSSMGTIVAAPTAGSCGTFPGAVIGVADALGKGEEEIIRALLAGSLVGVFIAAGSTFSAEIAGCQAECGSAGGMAAAGIVELLGGTLEQCISAASMTLQNSLGMICDPIAARVEAPCLGKNVSAATSALASANMAMSGYDPLIPIDEVIRSMDQVGKSLPMELRCTALGGLSVTPSAKELERNLKVRKLKS